MATDQGRRLLIAYEGVSSGISTGAVARDATLGGLFIETKQPLPLGALLTIEITAGQTKVVLDGRVISRRVKRDGPDRPVGMAVSFLDLPESAVAPLQSILARHRAPERTRLGVGDDPVVAARQYQLGPRSVVIEEEVGELPEEVPWEVATATATPDREPTQEADPVIPAIPAIPAVVPLVPTPPPGLSAPPTRAYAPPHVPTAPPHASGNGSSAGRRLLALGVVALVLALGTVAYVFVIR
jgi:PilZ domain